MTKGLLFVFFGFAATAQAGVGLSLPGAADEPTNMSYRVASRAYGDAVGLKFAPGRGNPDSVQPLLPSATERTDLLGGMALQRSASPAATPSAAGHASVYENPVSGVALDMMAETYSAGTGWPFASAGVDNAHAVEGGLSRSSGNWTTFGTLGLAGTQSDPAGIEYRTLKFASVGSAYRFSGRTAGGLLYDYRQGYAPDGVTGGGVTGFVSHNFSQGLKLKGYLSRNLTESYPAWGAGAVLQMGF